MRRGFTLIELVTYLGLLATLAAMVGSMESSVRRTVLLQKLNYDVQQVALAIEAQPPARSLRGDVRAATELELLDPHRLRLLTTQPGDASQAPVEVEWSFERGSLMRNGEVVARRLESFEFALEDGGVSYRAVAAEEFMKIRRRSEFEGWMVPRRSP